MSFLAAATGKVAGSLIGNIFSSDTKNKNLPGYLGAAGAATGMAASGISNMHNNKSSDMYSDMKNTDLYSQEFVNRNQDIIKNLLSDSGVDAQMIQRAQNGNMFASQNLKKSFQDIEGDYNTQYNQLQGAEQRQAGSMISNSTPQYQPPAYGQQGMKLNSSTKPRTKYSINTRNI